VVAAASILKDRGAAEVYCCVVHPVLSGDASKALQESAITEILVTDTLPVPEEKRFGRLEVLSVADMLGEAIHRIHSGLSVGAMFEH
jgi:ribose-phosphate pyrophosphokinase